MFNPIDKILTGEFMFIQDMTIFDRAILEEDIKKSSKFDEIVKNLLQSPFKQLTLNVIYNQPKYYKEVLNILTTTDIKLSYNQIKEFINAHPENFQYIMDNLDKYLKKDTNYILRIIIEYIINNNLDITKLTRIKDMTIRANIVKIVIKYHPQEFKSIFPDFIKYLYGYSYEDNEQLDLLVPIMKKQDIEEIAFEILDNLNDIALFRQLKQFILDNFKSNNLALIMQRKDDKFIKKEIKKEADKLFKTSMTPLRLLSDKSFSKNLSPKTKEDFKSKNSIFIESNSRNLDRIFYADLEEDLYKWMNICLEKSTNKTIRKIGSGVSAEVYQVGEYVIKLVKEKMTKAQILCPENYLILPNIYDRYITNERGAIIAGIEVQRLLDYPDFTTIHKLDDQFRDSLKAKGYILNDLLIRDGNPNVGLLPSYKEANCRNPEDLPEWFKKTPMVLIDRDLIYPAYRKKYNK